MKNKNLFETGNRSTPETQKANHMNPTKYLSSKFGIALCSALLVCTSNGQPSVSVGVSVALPSVEIRTESDFYEPLAPQGEWLVIGSYGRCWRPGHVDRDWRPYSEGYWQRTDDGWYWVSDEPWAWATYHYGRWDFTDQYGWYWVPQTQWAPAWVSWHSGGGYIGWAPMYPPGVRVISPRAYVFVEERHFTEPVRRSTVIVNNTTIINKTVINEAPATAAIEKASGRKVQQVAVRELRHKEEAPVVARQRTQAAPGENKPPSPVRNENAPDERKAAVTHESPRTENPAAALAEPAAPDPKHNEVPVEKHRPVTTTPELKPEARPEGNHPPAIKEPTPPQADKHSVKPENPVQPSNRKESPPAREKPAANDQNGQNPPDQNRGNKDHQ